MEETPRFQGSIVALVTPFKDGSLSREHFSRLVKFHLDRGTHGLVISGTTGESATLSDKDKLTLFEWALQEADSRIPVIAGVGDYNTSHTIELAQETEKLGVDGLLVITPYYNKPTQEGLFQHFMAVADKVSTPIIMYNVPSRTGVNMLPGTVERLSEHPNLVAVKEASGSLTQITDIIRRCQDKCYVLSGDDFLTLPVLAAGGEGVISVVANVIPQTSAELYHAFQAGDMKRAAMLSQSMLPLNQAMFFETNPIPVKTALYHMKWLDLEFRLPLCPMSGENEERLLSTLKNYDLLPETGEEEKAE